MATTDLHVDSSHAPGERIRLRERHAGVSPAAAGRAVLFIHGATYPGAMFDVPGTSWLAHAVADGYAAYALDVRGYGGSTRPAAMDGPPERAAPFARADAAIADIADCIATIRERAEVDTVDVVGWSWGTMTCGGYAATRPGTIGRLVLFAPVFRHRDPSRLQALVGRRGAGDPGALGAYRTVTMAQAAARWDADFDGDDPARWRAPGVLERWFDLMCADEPAEVVRAPNGVLLDLAEALDGRALYDAGAIDRPTLVVRGSTDATAVRADALGLYDALGGAHRQYAEIADGGHFLLLERRAPALFETVSRFLRGPLDDSDAGRL
ncbi:hypothetical protein SAOR_09550 [Salinisphaera orenii MK-B5]|uniref:AB hydrolase-1 domain-containing protein n=1 Tax=Salinisphaera orenii MK-B5 TaxID=856730 RepID=A0A423PNG3_9GAMM|nr:alpha/beta fold hydrolase [Salinisphaera orenii]ROO27061.1 hypothetical protein SAOR_09550 [Salinisphaera orenii MK-B5]